MYVFFPSFIVQVITTTDCHLSYEPIGQSTTMSNLDYVQPVQPSNSASSMAATPLLLAVIEDYNDDNNYLPTYAPHWPKKPPTPLSPAYNMLLISPPLYSVSLKDLDWDALIQCLYSVKLAAPPRPPPPASEAPEKGPPTTKLECMSTDDIVAHLQHPESYLLPIWPCDTPNLSDTKTTYTPKELHRLTGCCHFCNYQHIILTTKDGNLINTGESLYLLAPTQQSQKRHMARQSTGFRQSILTLSMSTSPSVIASQSEASNLPSSLSITPHATIGRLASSLSNTMTSKRPSLLFAMRPAPLLVNFNATAMKSCLAALYAHSST
jgi:hypothetical protein